MDELKPCFMCGHKVEIFTVAGETTVRCPSCGLFLDGLPADHAAAIYHYNTVADAEV